MNIKERKNVFSIATIYAFRMLGLFMILPVFSLYAQKFTYANASLIGIALGIYGLTQALLQIPFGMMSDRIGRKPIIIIGLILFAAGSIIAAESQNIFMVIVGRALQGAGAIGSTLTALIADTTQEENRLKAMAVIGMTIGFSFMLGIILGPILNAWVGLSGIFWTTAVLAAIGIIMTVLVIDTPKTHLHHLDTEPMLSQFKSILSMPELLRLDYGIFTMHAILTALFIALPKILIHNTHIPESHLWILYLPILVIAFIAMIPFIIIAESKHKMKTVFLTGICLLTIPLFLFPKAQHHLIAMSFLLTVFFTAFTLLEACLPSLVSKIAPAGSKGTAMGIYSSSQFLGIFIGGSVGGLIMHYFNDNVLFTACGLLSLAWLFFASTMEKPKHVSSKVIRFDKKTENIQLLGKEIRALPGVHDAMVCSEEHVIYLKIDKQFFSEKKLNALLPNT